MKPKAFVLLVLVVAGVAALFMLRKNTETRQEAVAVGLRAPAIEIIDAVKGGAVATDNLRGSVVFLNFWASWCQPCREEMPSVESLYRAMKGRGAFRMITVLYRDSPRSGLDYLNANGYSFPVYADRGDVSSRNYGVTGVPETYIIDKKGVLRQRVIGPADWSSRENTELILSLLNE